MKIEWKHLITCIAIPLALGSLSALLTQNSMASYMLMNKPAASPPGWLFPIVWTILYLLMGTASYLVLTSGKPNETALIAYGIQLGVQFLWPILFFNLGLCWAAFLWLILLWLLIIFTTRSFFQISKPAGYLMLPYLLWVTFAAYLNLSICLL